MGFSQDWEELFRKVDAGVPLRGEEERYARAVRAVRAAGGNVPAADPRFLGDLGSALRAEYLATYGADGTARPGIRLSGLARAAVLGAGALAALAGAFFLGWRPEPEASPEGLPYALRALAGFLALASASYAALGVFLAARASLACGGRGCAAVRVAAPGLAFFLAVVFGLAFALTAHMAASFGDLLPAGGVAAFFGLFEGPVFLALCAACAAAVVSAVGAAARKGPAGFFRLAVTLAAAPSLPSICLYLFSAHPNSGLANLSFLGLNALAVAATAWPRPEAANRLDRLMAAACVLAVSFPLYAYFLQPRTAASWEISAWCLFTLGWAAFSAVPLARRLRAA